LIFNSNTVSTINLDTVTLKIGEAEITAHKAMLTAVSDYFRNAFDGPFREANERSIALEGVSVRSLKMFLQWAYIQSLHFDTPSVALGFDTLLPELAEDEPNNESESDTKGGFLFDEKPYWPVSYEEKPYLKNKKWDENMKKFHLSLAELFIFADKYSVPQLRDDVVTAFVGQCWKWDAFPAGNNKALILLTATNLPASSMLKEFFACCIAWVGLVQDEMRDIKGMMRSLRELDCNASKSPQIGVFLEEHIPNACVFHDHEHLNEDQCRKRIASRPQIFTAILDACAKAVMTEPAEDE
jgi:hypothetical protein